jgi:DMSO/TMAO reductase YedYZ heme-binding membrane subunit
MAAMTLAFIDWSQVSLVWVAERATGLTALALLTLSTFLGTVVSAGWSSRRFPEVRAVSLHRNIALLTLAFLVVHVFGAIADQYVEVPLSSALIPFTSTYKTVWVGLGTLAFDLLLALLITSVLRDRINAGLWRLIHDFTYVCWGLATVHALAAGFERGLTFTIAVAGILLVVPTTIMRYVRPHERPELEKAR